MNKLVQILLVEDNPADARLTRDLLNEGRAHCDFHTVEDGEKAVSYLQSRVDVGLSLPDIIILDLNLPRMDGRQVLKTIKNDPLLRRIPVLVFSTSETIKDINACYDHHANCYFTKPNDLDGLIRLLKNIEECWLTTAKLPPQEIAI